MRELYILAEHRRGELRDITFEMLSKAREISEATKTQLTAILLGYNTKSFAEGLSEYAERVLVVDNPILENFNAEIYQKILAQLIKECKPLLILVGHSAFGVDLAPSLAAELGIPLATDCIDFYFEEGKLYVIRQMYGGKVSVKASLRESESYIITARPATFKVKEPLSARGEIVNVDIPILSVEYRRFIEYAEPPKGEVDIVAADIIISIGRGIKDEKNIPIVKELADMLGGVLACSRPVVDKGWLPKDRQVGSSGKTVKPKLYMAIGISGAFQHIMGMKNSDLIIAINKDPRAAIFGVSDYGIVDDLFKVVPALKDKLRELASARL